MSSSRDDNQTWRFLEVYLAIVGGEGCIASSLGLPQLFVTVFFTGGSLGGGGLHSLVPGPPPAFCYRFFLLGEAWGGGGGGGGAA